MRRRVLRLFVWHDVLRDHYGGVMFALAHDVDEARELIRKTDRLAGEDKDLARQPNVYDAPVGFAVWGGG